MTKEVQVKAAILFNLARFSTWENEQEASSEDDFVFCTLTDNGMRDAVQALEGKTIHSRPLNVDHVSRPEEISEHCQLVYVSEDVEDIDLKLKDWADRGVLAVGENKNFLDQGGSMVIFRKGDKMRFSVNRDALKSAQIRPGAKLLKLAVAQE